MTAEDWVFGLFTHREWQDGTPEAQQGDRTPEEGDWPCGSVVCPDGNRVPVKGEKCAKCRDRIERKYDQAQARLKKKTHSSEHVETATPWVKLGEKETTARRIEYAARKEKQQLERGVKPEEVYGDRL